MSCPNQLKLTDSPFITNSPSTIPKSTIVASPPNVSQNYCPNDQTFYTGTNCTFDDSGKSTCSGGATAIYTSTCGTSLDDAYNQFQHFDNSMILNNAGSGFPNIQCLYVDTSGKTQFSVYIDHVPPG